MLFPSARYGVDPLLRLTESIDTKVMLTSGKPSRVIEEVIEKRSMKAFSVPEVDWLVTKKTAPYPFTKTFEKHKDKLFVYLRRSLFALSCTLLQV